MKYILTGGGSGGHIYPLLSFAKLIKQIDPKAEFLYVGNKKKLENKIVPKYGIKFCSINSSPTKGKYSIKNIKAFFNIIIGYIQSKYIISKFSPHVCIGSGGYVSVPVLLSVVNSKKIVSCIFESDYCMGKANTLLAKKVDVIFSGLFNLKDKYFKDNNRYFHVGNPRIEDIKSFYKQNIIKDKILFLGGSQGADTINKQAVLFARYLKKVKDSNFKVVLISGEKYFKKYKDSAKFLDNIVIKPYVEDLYNYYTNSILAVVRPSAGILSECIAFNLPMIGVPSPNVMSNHQWHNMKYLVDNGIGFLFDEKNIRENNFSDYVYSIIKNKSRLQKMGLPMENIIKSNVSVKMFEIIDAVRKSK